MGIKNNEVVIATTWNKKALQEVREWIYTVDPKYRKLFVIIQSIVNGEYTIVLGPDGSGKGWTEDNEGRILRNTFISKLKTFDYEDGSNPFKYVEVGYGDFGQKVLRGNCKNTYSDDEYYKE